jgi:hypothetical protein
MTDNGVVTEGELASGGSHVDQGMMATVAHKACRSWFGEIKK